MTGSSGDARHPIAVIVLVAVAALLPVAVADTPTAEAELWQRIEARQKPAALRAESFAGALENRRKLLDDARLYLNLYPGGAHHEQAVSVELSALYEIGTLSGGNLDALHERVRAYLAAATTEGVRQEAAYWEMTCRRVRKTPTTRPSEPVDTLDSGLRRDYAEYIRRYPTSRHTPRLAAALFDEAQNAEDLAQMRRLVQLVRKHRPHGMITETLVARLACVEAVGKPFPLVFTDPDAATAQPKSPANAGIREADYAGCPVLIVVWAGKAPTTRECLSAIEEFRQDNAALRVIGVNLDPSRTDVAGICEDLQISWPQVHDGLGWAGWFARRWGVREAPTVFARDRHGILRGVSDADGWRALADKVAED